MNKQIYKTTILDDLSIKWKLCLLFLVVCNTVYSNPADKTGVYSLNHNWFFQKLSDELGSTEPVKENWESVDIPHTPQIEPLLVNEQWQGISYYKKTIDLSKLNDTHVVWLKFGAAMNIADVWINDNYLGKNYGGYLPFIFDITKYIGQANLDIKVRLNNKDNWITGPKPLHLLDFNTYGGIYRDVTLIVKDKLHISEPLLESDNSSAGVFVTFPTVSESNAIVKIHTNVVNGYEEKNTVSVKQTLFYKDDEIESTILSEKLTQKSNFSYSQSLNVKEPKLWHPNEPNLYRLVTDVIHEGRVIDSVSTRIGIRSYEFTDDHKLLINGKPFFLRGVNRHQEYPHVGYATSPQADRRDAVRIKSAGFDYIRLSHYPHSKAFMEAADELGLVLINAILGWQYYSPFPEFEQQIYRTCRDLIRRDRNHPSVLAWECSLNESWMPEYFIKELHNIVQREYPGAYSAGWQKGYDIYLQARQHRLEHYDEPNQPYNVSEYGDWEYYASNAGLNQDAWGDLQPNERNSRQLLGAGETRLLQQATNVHEAHNDNLKIPAFADGYWAMFDYNRGYADDLEASGLSSIYRIPKYSYYFFQSQRGPEFVSPDYESGPMVYVASDWVKTSNTEIRIFTNTEEVELWLNGKKIDSRKPIQKGLSSHLNHPPIYFQLPKFEAGTLEAKGYIDNKLVANHKVTTPSGPAKSLKIIVDDAQTQIGNSDLVIVHAQLLDEHKNPTYENGKVVDFQITGDAELINPNQILTEKGFASAVIRTSAEFREATIKVTSNKLKPQHITISTRSKK